jgi:hypothetical protein
MRLRISSIAAMAWLKAFYMASVTVVGIERARGLRGALGHEVLPGPE